MRNKLICEFAHSGILFWLPLVSCPDYERAKSSANTGLWLLIAGTGARLIMLLFEAINAAFPAGILHVIVSGVYSLIFMIYILFMLYLAWKNIRTVCAIHRGEGSNEFEFFSAHPIIS